MIENMDYIIQTFPSIIYDRDESQVMTDLQKSIYDFVWNRKEVRGDQSGQSLIVNLHGHTGNADTEEDDNRITIASLDNQESKIKNVRIRLEASKAEEQEPYAIAKEPTKLKCTPNLFNKKQKRNETDNVIAEKKPKINSINNMTSNH
ncbi:MAG: hypothetical protein VX835_04010 [Pseudomonadota bacterium]|nr:hypothetical protein [Pseudomonadota bacterium]